MCLRRTILNGLGLAVGMVILPQTAHAQSVLYVDYTAAGANDGSSWCDAYTDLQFAFGLAVSGDEIRVAEGIYRPAGPGGDRTATFQLKGV